MIWTRLRSVLLITSLSGSYAWAASPWLPGAGKVSLTETFASDSFLDYRQGATPRVLPLSYDQHTQITSIEYGLKDNITIDVETGHTSADFKGNQTSGVMDSVVGFRWAAKKGERWVFTVRGAAIIRGSYDVTTVGNWSAGDKASGVQGSGIFGYMLPKGFFTFTELGYRVRNNHVPQDFFGNGGLGYYAKGFTLTTDYQTSRSINGVDISGGLPKFNPPYFTAAMFPWTKKIFGAVDESIAYGFRNGLSLGFTYSKMLHGRNVGLKDVFAGSVGFTFPGRVKHL